MTETSFTVLPLYSESNYSYAAVIGDKTYSFSFQYNERSASWYMSIKDENQVPVVQGVRLIPNYPLVADYALESFNGYFILSPRSTSSTDEYISKPMYISSYYELRYIETK